MIHRINALLRVGRITLSYDDGPIQRVQIDEGDLAGYGGRRIIDKAAHIQHFGFSARPPVTSEAMLAAPTGDRTQTIVIGTNHQPSRPRDLIEGDSCLYSLRGQRIWLTEGELIVDGGGLPVRVTNTPKLRVEADVIECTGDIVGRADGTRVSLNALHDAYNEHAHTGVAAGTASTGPTDHNA